jgi:predicted RNase H-like HicB family nuclease
MSSIAEVTHKRQQELPQPSPPNLEDVIDRVQICECCGAPAILTPILKCAHCNEILDIKCFVYERHGSFYGQCLTLNLISRGATQEEAIRRLQGAMFSYVKTVLEDGKSAAGLIPRRAPVTAWIRYYVHLFSARFLYIFGRDYPLATRSTPIDWSAEYKIVHC